MCPNTARASRVTQEEAKRSSFIGSNFGTPTWERGEDPFRLTLENSLRGSCLRLILQSLKEGTSWGIRQVQKNSVRPRDFPS